MQNWASHVAKYYSPEFDKSKIIKDNKRKSGIYLFINNKNLKYYVGQSKDLGSVKIGRLTRYLNKSYLKSNPNSLLVRAFIKYGYNNFTLAILEYCAIEKLDEREQYWIDFLKPEYNILKFVKSSRGYKHTEESKTKMRGKRINFKITAEQRARIIHLNKTRIYSKDFREKLSKLHGFTVYVYDDKGNFITNYSSINNFKKAYNIKWHHNTIKNFIKKNKSLNGHRFSFTTLTKDDFNNINSFELIDKNRARKISLTNIKDSNSSIEFNSINSAVKYIKKVDGTCDKATLKKYINTKKLYHKIWLINENLI